VENEESEYTYANFKERFCKARCSLLSKKPFFGQLAMHLKLKVANWMPTTAVDIRGNFYYNEEWVKKLSQVDLEAEICHELGHLFTKSFDRFPEGGNKAIWNKASDIKVDTLIMMSDVTPSWVMEQQTTEELREKYAENDTWEVYCDLMKNAPPPQSCPACGGTGQEKEEGEGDNAGSGGGECKFCNGTGTDCSSGEIRQCTSSSMSEGGATKKEIEAWKQKASAAAQEAKSRGHLPGALEGWIEDLLAPKAHWTDYLRVKAQQTMKRRWSWRVAGRRGEALGIRLPGKSPHLPTAVIAIDTSGSMSKDEIIKAFSESAEILRITGGRVRLILFDAEVYFDQEVDCLTSGDIQVQRGGTCFDTVFEHLEEKKPQLLVFFTDLYAPYPTEHPGYPVVWGLTPHHNEEPVPFGETVVIED
jgi:predicted metal-dependent peptidase